MESLTVQTSQVTEEGTLGKSEMSSSSLPDELDCSIFTLDKSYLKEVPPETDNGEDGLTPVYLDVEVLSILEISEVDTFISLQLNLLMTWTDQRSV